MQRTLAPFVVAILGLSSLQAGCFSESDGGSGAGTDTGSGATTATDPGTSSGATTATDTGAGSGGATTTDPGTGSDATTTTDPGTGSDATTTTDPGTGSDATTTTDPGNSSGATTTGTGTVTGTETGTTTHSQTDTSESGTTAGDCTSGPCCDIPTGTYKSPSEICDTWTEYQCDGNACGSNAEQRVVEQYCSGDSAACDGLEFGSWSTLENCGLHEICESDGATGAECLPCAHGCHAGACWPDCDPATDDCCEDDGTFTPPWVEEPGAGLAWLRCALGQTWDTSTCTCTGNPTFMNWCVAMGAAPGTVSCPTDPPGASACAAEAGNLYGLPTLDEYNAMTGVTGCTSGTTCYEMFGSDSGRYWSSSNISDTEAYTVSLLTGHYFTTDKPESWGVRCVRSYP